MTRVQALTKFGLVPDVSYLNEIRRALVVEARRRKTDEESSDDYDDTLLVLCVQLFAARQVEDSLSIWRAKQCDFDAACYIDGELLCGAGVEVTIDYLEKQDTKESLDVLEYILLSDWKEFTPEKHLAQYFHYFGLSEDSSSLL